MPCSISGSPFCCVSLLTITISGRPTPAAACNSTPADAGNEASSGHAMHSLTCKTNAATAPACVADSQMPHKQVSRPTAPWPGSAPPHKQGGSCLTWRMPRVGVRQSQLLQQLPFAGLLAIRVGGAEVGSFRQEWVVSWVPHLQRGQHTSRRGQHTSREASTQSEWSAHKETAHSHTGNTLTHTHTQETHSYTLRHTGLAAGCTQASQQRAVKAALAGQLCHWFL